jgi:hypothetical protein
VASEAERIVAGLSLDEKIELMGGDPPFWPGPAEMMSPGGYNSHPWPAGGSAVITAAWRDDVAGV